jgi:hypothetical protein
MVGSTMGPKAAQQEHELFHQKHLSGKALDCASISSDTRTERDVKAM